MNDHIMAESPGNTSPPAHLSSGGFRSFFREVALPVICALLLVIVLYVITAILKNRWADNVSWDLHLVLSQGRDIVAALITGVVAGWVIIRKSPALLSATSPDNDIYAGNSRNDRIRLYAQWFMAMRWIAVIVTGVLVYISIPVLALLPREALLPLTSVTLVMAFSNLAYLQAMRKQWNAQRLLLIQAYVDLVLLTVLLHYSGGIENPLSGLMLFHVIIGGILLAHRECYRIAAVGSFLYALLAIGEASGVLSHYGLEFISHRSVFSQATPVALHIPYATSLVILHAVILFLTAYFVSTLAERLRKNEQRLATMAEHSEADRQLLVQALETTNTGLRVLTMDLVPSWTNGRWREWFGPSRDCCSIFPEAVGCPAKDCIDRGEIHVMEMDGPHSEDKNKAPVFQITSAPIRDGKGEIIRVVQLAQDITNQKEANAKMMRAGQMAAVGELAGQVAHEVNNPIAIISAKSRILLSNRRDEMSDKIASELEKITGLSNRVARIAQGLLSYCRPSPASRQRIDICQPIRASLAMVEERTASIGIKINDNLPQRAIWVVANMNEMEQVFLNLFLNAIQAMPDGGEISVSVLADENSPGDNKSGARITIAIDDSGQGVDPSLRERIFEPFFTTKAEVHGTGLGLSICQGLVHSHGGKIHIGDSPLGGARFAVSLPTSHRKTNT